MMFRCDEQVSLTWQRIKPPIIKGQAQFHRNNVGQERFTEGRVCNFKDFLYSFYGNDASRNDGEWKRPPCGKKEGMIDRIVLRKEREKAPDDRK
ncbi:hypothetical protein CHUAL_010401 [Chamberlinius hualienensis]